MPSTSAALGESRRPAQELGRKGLETRRRLMVAALDLLQTMSAVSLTTAAVARHASTSPATFYVYFDDVGDLVLALAREATDDLDEVRAALAAWRAGESTEAGARAFFGAYRAYWDRHRAILSLRNMEADRGDARFLETRSSAGILIIVELAALIRDGHPAGTLSEDQSLARATVIFAAIERLAAAASIYPSRLGRPHAASEEALSEAQVAILTSLVRN